MTTLKYVFTHKATYGLIIVFICCILGYVDYGLIGFFDGHHTEYDRFLKYVLYPIFFIINVLFIFFFIAALLKKINNYWGILLYLLFIILFLASIYYYSTHLENGQGG
ncbi:hypothetical protein [Aquimarina aquimarini]|uniref:hypothetical protein n=1 Tax=Aquimarina aquimarini TaxID=1191734 RepID=UPI001F2AF8DD|nr:hypothetical protein [Aquimarina aquimarini]